MENKKSKAKSVVFGVLLIIFMGNLIRTSALDTIRTVDFLQILAIGACAGFFIASLFSGSKK